MKKSNAGYVFLLFLGLISASLFYIGWVILGTILGIATLTVFIGEVTGYSKRQALKEEKNKEKEEVKIIKEKLKPLISEFNKQKKVVLKLYEKFKVNKKKYLTENKSDDIKVTPDDFYELVKDYSKELKDIGKNENEDYLFQCSQIKSFLVESHNNIKKLHKLIKD